MTRSFVIAAAALGLMTSAALAEPKQMTEEQMDTVTAAAGNSSDALGNAGAVSTGGFLGFPGASVARAVSGKEFRSNSGWGNGGSALLGTGQVSDFGSKP